MVRRHEHNTKRYQRQERYSIVVNVDLCLNASKSHS